ncbi:MAG TPA: RIP metalloprotease RseP [Gemmatimonadales bacterium]|nr:RIP metalloprotease RseP [Gemmatimonadales bacterium]
MILTVFAFAIMVGVLIFVHELGHFVAAKSLGIQVHRFSLGFGKPIVMVRRGETEYCIAVLPLGGYVKMAGLEEEGMMGEIEGGKPAQPVDPARAFDRRPLWIRIVVILAGVTMNALLAYAIYAARAASVGLPVADVTEVDSVYAGDLPSGAEALGTLRFGDRLLRINGDTIRHWGNLESGLMDGPVTATLDVVGRATPLRVRLGDGSARDRSRVYGAISPRFPARLGIVEPGRPGYRAGLKPGDVIVRADGDTIGSWSQAVAAIWAHPGVPMQLDVRRGDSLLSFKLTPESITDSAAHPPRPVRYGQIGVSQNPPVQHERIGLGRALVQGWGYLWEGLKSVVSGLAQLVLGKASLRQSLAGPIEIASVSGQVARLGYDWYLDMLAFFSINLAVLNLLPIPVLDGGQLVFLIAEGIRRRPLSLELRLRLTQVGFVFLLGLMSFALLNGVFKFFGR